jgi:hypothetical protein
MASHVCSTRTNSSPSDIRRLWPMNISLPGFAPDATPPGFRCSSRVLIRLPALLSPWSTSPWVQPLSLSICFLYTRDNLKPSLFGIDDQRPITNEGSESGKSCHWVGLSHLLRQDARRKRP